MLKISDFGLSRHGVYVNTRTRMLPLRWLALESMTDNLYSSQSDVWAFGVVLWEICTLGNRVVHGLFGTLAILSVLSVLGSSTFLQGVSRTRTCRTPSC